MRWIDMGVPKLSSRILKVGVIDDEPSELLRTCNLLSGPRLDLLSTSKESEVDSVLSKATGGLILDARTDAFSRSSIAIARKYSTVQPGRPVFVVSNFFGSGKYDKLESMISPASPVQKLTKSDLAEESTKEWISDELLRAAESLPTGLLGRARLEAPRIDGGARRALRTSPEDWEVLDVDAQDELSEALTASLQDYIRQVFETSQAGWFVIGGQDAAVLRWSNDPGSIPGDDLLQEIEAMEGVVPFLFVRDLEVDSIVLEGGIPWPGSGQNAHYPSLVAEFADEALPTEVELLFDTGADHNYIDRSFMRDRGLPVAKFTSTGFRLGRAVSYRERAYPVNLLDGIGFATGSTSFRVVSKWSTTIGYGKTHPGLLSNLALTDLAVAIRICGRTRTVRIDQYIDEN
jgi:hypothetical protein